MQTQKSNAIEKGLFTDPLILDFKAQAGEGPAIDREQGIIRGVQIARQGIARGHGLWLDEKFIDGVVTLGSGARRGIKARFGHPNACSPSFGAYVGRFTNFRKDFGEVDGKQVPMVRADFAASKSAASAPGGNMTQYIFDRAEHEPDTFGVSISFMGKKEYRVDAAGQKEKDSEGNELLPLARIEVLNASDFVDDPAATEGLFAEPLEGDDLDAHDRQALRKAINSPALLDRVLSILTVFKKRFDGSGDDDEEESVPLREDLPAEANEETESMNWNEVTLEALQTNRPDLFQAAMAKGAQEIEAKFAEAVTGATNAERERVVNIFGAARGHQLTRGKALELVKDGSTELSALKSLMADDESYRTSEVAKLAEASSAVKVEASENADAAGGTPTDFMSAVKQLAADKGITEYAALRECKKLYPDLHAKFANFIPDKQ